MMRPSPSDLNRSIRPFLPSGETLAPSAGIKQSPSGPCASRLPASASGALVAKSTGKG